MSTKKFIKSVNSVGGSKFSDWKKKGKTTGFIHPKLGFYERNIHGIISSIETARNVGDDLEIFNRRFICKNDCPLCQLIIFAGQKIYEGVIDGGEKVLDSGDRSYTSHSFDDLAGLTGWKSDPKCKTEYVIPWISCDVDRDRNNLVEILVGPLALGISIQNLISSQIDDLGEDDGDLLLNPYPIKLLYNADEIPTRKYNAQPVSLKAIKLDDRINKIFEMSEKELDIDLNGVVEPNDHSTILQAIKSTWVCGSTSYDEFLDFGGYRVKKIGTRKKDNIQTKDDTQKKDNSNNIITWKCPECGEVVDGKFCHECGCAELNKQPFLDDDVPF